MKVKSIILILVLFVAKMIAQTSCQTAQPFCVGAGNSITFPATTGNVPAQAGPFYDCLLTQPNPAWYYIQISTAGTLSLTIQGQINNGPGQDVDFVCWGPFSSLTNICNNLTAANVVDCSYSSSFTETLTATNAQVGQYYMVCITNFANVTQNIVFGTLNGNTATSNCGLLTSSNNTICAGSSFTINTTSGVGLSNITYSVMPGNIVTTSPSIVVTPLVNTSYTIFASGINSASAAVTNTSVSNFTVFQTPSAITTVTQANCTSPTIAVQFNLSAVSPSPAPNYSITLSPAVPGVSTTAGPVFTCSPGSSGPYQYTVSILPGGCKTTGSFVINPIPQPITFSIQNTSLSSSITCNNPSVTLQALSNYTAGSLTYSWTSTTFTASTSSITLTPAQVSPSLVVTCVAIDPVTTCSALNTFTVGTNTTAPTMTVSPLSQTVNCAVTSVATFTGTALSPTSNVTHNWYSSGNVLVSSNQGSVSIQNLGLGTYTYCAVNNTNGCSTCSVVAVNTGTSYATFSLTSSTNFSLGCAPTKNTTTINITNAQTFPTPGGLLTFTFWPPSVSSGTTFNSVTSLVTTTPGLWTAVAKDPVSQCLTQKQFSIIQNTISPHSQISINNNAVNSLTLNCFTPSVVAVGSSTVQNTNISWVTPSGTNIPQSTVNIAVTTNTSTNVVGTYSLIVKDNNNDCITVQPFLVNQFIAPPTASISALSTPSFISCYNTPVTLLNVSTGFGGSSAVAVTWNGPSPQIPGGAISTYDALIPGIYTLTVRDISNGCLASGTKSVSENKTPPILNTPPPFILDCGQQSVLIYPIVANAASSYSYGWTAVGGAASVGITPPSSLGSASTNVTNPGFYRVSAVNLTNGCRATTTVQVINGVLTASFTPSPNNGFAPLNVNFNNISASTGSAATASITCSWAFGNGSVFTSTAISSPATVYNSPGTYTAVLIAQKGSCKDTVEQVIIVDAASKFEIPNVFTPNGDGSNDKFFLRTTNITEIDAVIFDRWGNKVFEMISDKGNIEWDGKNQYGKECASGTYFYIIKLKGKDGKENEQKGTVSIYR